MDCFPFLNWRVQNNPSESKNAVVFRSLVATVKSQTSVDVSFEAQAVKSLKSVKPNDEESADAFLSSFVSSTDESLNNFVQCIMVLISSTSRAITTAAMKMLDSLLQDCSAKVYLSLVKADLIPEIVITLNPQTLSFDEGVDIHISIMESIRRSLWRATPDGLADLGIEDSDEQQAVLETVFKHVLAPSAKYIWHLCMNRYSIVDADMSNEFMILLTRILEISPSHQPIMDFVLHIPVVLTIPSCLTAFEDGFLIWHSLRSMILIQREWNKKRGVERQMGKTVLQMLRMEGIEDVVEAQLQHDKQTDSGRWVDFGSIEWNNLQGMNLPWRR
ncbi:hypothetical protein BLNAU_9828 [Blattamonas nauphoetae]|uniref:Uncharacterized protein n=1 Tax=Blattamonas nauphoetae TaxID=2049346 RepID=A0ABQ9XUX8_9EUKA|nr:hypothetical protein BLNAU_9828 [Blattamonas nauphoetae]